jgi:hypothetical protein
MLTFACIFQKFWAKMIIAGLYWNEMGYLTIWTASQSARNGFMKRSVLLITVLYAIAFMR